ncbi:glycerol-3-phosphate dehydrogenase [Aspergillus hancockii]|nr:glycerol-3-phosphate dehydrogenase [Aspergillus hancockii]
MSPQRKQHTVAVIGSGNLGLNNRQNHRRKHRLTPRPLHPQSPNVGIRRTNPNPLRLLPPQQVRQQAPAPNRSNQRRPRKRQVPTRHPVTRERSREPEHRFRRKGRHNPSLQHLAQFIDKTLDQIKAKHLPHARAISCVKGVDVTGGMVTLFSELIMEKLGIYCGSLSGANIAPEVAAEKFSETTIGYDTPPMDVDAEDGSPKDNKIKIDEQRQVKTRPTHTMLRPVPLEYVTVDGELMRTLFGRPYFHVNVVDDVAGVALSGALKNIVALAAGFVAGKGWGENGKVAVIRIGVSGKVKFGRTWFPQSVNERTFTEKSAGIADLVASCYAGRSFRSAKHAVEKRVTVGEIEKSELNGQKLQGTSTARSV